MAPLAVDPEALSAAGNAVVAAGDGVAAALAVLTAGFGANTGLDAAGAVFGLAYQDAAESLMKAAAAAINACRFNGAKIQLCASNYSVAEAASMLGGGTGVLRPPGEPVRIAAPGPPGTLGPGQPPPLLWALVQSFVGDVWPDGDVAGLYAAASSWRGFAGAVGGTRAGVNASTSLVGAQQIAEGDLIHQVLSELGTGMDGLGEQCVKMAGALDEFADEVGHAQDAIRDLLHRLGSASGLWHEVVSILDGDLLEEVKRIAGDIRAVLHNLGRQARAVEQMMQLGMQVVDGLVVGMEKHVRGQLTQFLGEEVGNPVATVFDTWVNANEGAFKSAFGMVQSIEQLDPRWFVIDPEGAATTWKGMTKTGLINHFLNPQEAVEADRQMVSSLLHLDDWRADRPGLGLGGNLFDVATLFVGGGSFGAGAKCAAVGARGAEVAGDLSKGAGAVGRGGGVAGEIGELAGAGGALGDIAKTSRGLTEGLENLMGELTKTDPPLGGAPTGLPSAKPPEAPVEPTPRPLEPPQPVKATTEPPTVPQGSAAAGRPGAPDIPHEPVPSAGSYAAPAPAAGERPPRLNPNLGESAPAQASVSPGRSPSEPLPDAVHSSQRVPPPASTVPHAATPDFTSPSIRPLEPPQPPPPIGSPHGYIDGALPDGQPLEPPPEGDASKHSTVGSHDPGSPASKVAGRDFPLAPEQALPILSNPGAELERLAAGNVPAHVLEGYDPLAGRTTTEFEREFTIRSEDGKLAWDWQTQAPNNGFASVPEVSDHIPKDLRLDRIGPNQGAFMSPEGAPLAERATPPGLASQYHTMSGTGERVPHGWEVHHGPAKDAFGQPGGAEQWVVIDQRTRKKIPVEVLDLVGVITSLTK
ncbi:TNT domain-containing protein [Mycobacterium riyadhense]|uniref:TNT domain-containing protein n=2 Tax=Mycobacterium riyadhense TaxID=486698 RepID=UPI00195982DF|nr:TNT domain-containing protein [Mycobacterium riyadhense]